MFVWNHQSDEDVRQIVQSSWKPMLRTKVRWETNKNGNQCWEPKSVWWKHMETKPKMVSPSLNKTMKIFGKFWKPKCWEPPTSHEKKDHETGKSMMVNPMGAAFSTAAWPILWAPVVFPSRATAFVREIFHGPAATQTMLIKTRAWRLCLVYVYVCNRLYIYI